MKSDAQLNEPSPLAQQVKPRRGARKTLDRVVILALAVVLSLNILNPSYVAYAALIGLVYLFIRSNTNVLLSSLTVSGLFLFALFKEKFEISASILVIIQTAVMIWQIARSRSPVRNATGSRNSSAAFAMWSFWLLVLISFQYWAGPGTAFSDFLYLYFLVYSLYYVVTGILVVRGSIEIDTIVLPSVLFMSAIYPLIDMSIVDLSGANLSQYGLRTVENFGAIAHDRIAAQFLVLSVAAFVLSKDRWAIFPEVAIGCVLSLPIVWFSYTRQSLLGAFLGMLLMAFKTFFQRRDDLTRRARLLLVSAIAVLLLAGVSWVSTQIELYSSSRMGQIALGSSGQTLVSTDDLSSQTRIELYRYTWQHIMEHPFLGYGLGGFADLYEASGAGAWPHNWFLEAWLEYGVAGLILFLLAAAYVLRGFVYGSGIFLSGWMLLGVFWLFLVQVSANIPQNAPIFLFIAIAFLYRGRNFETHKSYSIGS